MECPRCSAQLPTTKAKFCPRCGAVIGPIPLSEEAQFDPPSKPIHLEKRGSLFNPLFLFSVVVVVMGGLLSVELPSDRGIVVLVVGIMLLILTMIRSLGR